MELTTNNKLHDFINECEEQFNQVLINNNITFAQEALFSMQLLERNEYLLNVARNSPKSLRNAVLNVATIGLSLNPSMALAYLVPRKIGNKIEVCLDISYLGFLKLAQDCGSIVHVKAEIVHENDIFNVTGPFTMPEHRFSPFSERGAIIGAYCVATTPEGSILSTIMPIDEIFSIRDMSESWKKPEKRGYSPWFKFESEMIKKTVVRRSYKSWPKTNKFEILNKAIELSDQAQGIEFEDENADIKALCPYSGTQLESGHPDYVFQNSKFRGRALKGIDTKELEDYLIKLERRAEKNDLKNWELECKASIQEYLETIFMESENE